MLLSYKFQIEGVEAVKQAIASVEQRYVQSAKATDKSGKAKVNTQKQVNNLKTKEIKDEELLTKLTEMRWKDEIKGIKRAEQERIRASGRASKQEARDKIKAQKEVEREEKRTKRAREKFASGIAGTAGSSVRGTVGLGMRVAGSIGGIVGGLAVGDSIARAVDDQKRIRALVIQGNHGLNDKQVNEAVTKEAIGTGQDKGDIIGGLSKFVGVNGDIKLAVDALHVMNTAAIATGASMDDIAEASAQAFAHGHIKDAKELGDLLAVWAEQGKKGTFELKDLSGLMGRIGALYDNMGLGSAEGLKVAGGISQIVRGSVGGPEQAITAQEAFKAQIIKHSKDLESGKAFGGAKFQIFTDKGKTSIRDIRTLIPDILRQSGGNQAFLQKNLSTEGMAFIQPFQAVFTKAMNAATGNRGQKREAGAHAVTELLNQNIDAGGVDFHQLEKDSADAQKTLASDMSKIRNEFDKEITTNLLPALTRLVPEIRKLIPYVGVLAEKFVSLATTFADHPLAGVMAIIGGKMVADVGSAMLGKAIGSAFTGMMTSSMGGLGGSAAFANPIALAFAGAVGGAAVGTALAKVFHDRFGSQASENLDAAMDQGDQTDKDNAVIDQGKKEQSNGGHLSDDTKSKLEAIDKRKKEAASKLADENSGWGKWWKPGDNAALNAEVNAPDARKAGTDTAVLLKEEKLRNESARQAAKEQREAAADLKAAATALKTSILSPLPTGRDPGDPH